MKAPYNMSLTNEAEPKVLDKETLTSEGTALSEMLSADKSNGELSPEDNAAYRELIEENREAFVALNKAGEATVVESTGEEPAPTTERPRQSALDHSKDTDLEKAREAVMRQFGNIEDDWRVTK